MEEEAEDFVLLGFGQPSEDEAGRFVEIWGTMTLAGRLDSEAPYSCTARTTALGMFPDRDFKPVNDRGLCRWCLWAGMAGMGPWGEGSGSMWIVKGRGALGGWGIG